MIVVNTTFHVESSIEQEWVAWVHATYLAIALSSGVHCRPLFLKIMSQMEGGAGYAVQVHADSESDADRWLNVVQPKLLAEMHGRWGEKALFFTTLMQEVEA